VLSLLRYLPLHPLRVESVAWAAERKDVLSMFLGLAVLYNFMLYTLKSLKLYKYYVCLILFALALLAKAHVGYPAFCVVASLITGPLGRWQKGIETRRCLRSAMDAGLAKKRG